MSNAAPPGHFPSANRDELPTVTGRVSFARRSTTEAAPAVDVPGYEGMPMVEYEIPVRNARAIQQELSLDKEGFQLVQHTSAFDHLRDPEVLREKYLEEMAPFIQQHFGASWVIPRRKGLVVRSASSSPAAGIRQPGGMAHIDFAPVAGPMVAAAENQVQGLPIRPYSRVMLIQAWRPLSAPPQDFPLALCDASTQRRSDVLSHDFQGYSGGDPGSSYRSCLLHHHARQRFYYFPEMGSDEVILFKGYDSAVHYQPQPAHCAFDDRTTFPSAVPRESVEARFFVYFE